ncbi:response regulator [Heliophilum fasciatum]|uniref:Stage 0 sporulation protein A homolog n=1 Tax=Heliophilum fasciatum TaxID=35700 RepID=A0A4R2RRD5_9FIRM|nr:response regulator [Heliophilum fasciatum]MCW2278760.1 two-component SAPR family response regulator [Heliophilum fasciatum]TCP62431.1 response regulator receiver domain-containing protein [Heliophilum fasciatum]
MIRAIVVDDEWFTLEYIRERLAQTGWIQVVKEYENPLEAFHEIAATAPHVAFIDVEMPAMDGMTLAEKLLEANPLIHLVFITAYSQYAVRAFDLNAVDYLLKPINPERFGKMLTKLQSVCAKLVKPATTLRIQCFGHFAAWIDDIPVKWERMKAEEVFAYLLMHQGTRVHKNTIIEHLWPGYEIKKAIAILQASIHKIRSVFARLKDQVVLEYANSSYCLMIHGADCDYLSVMRAITQFRSDDQRSYEALEQAARHYVSISA